MAVTTMDISDDEDMSSDTDTWIYCDEDIHAPDAEINENNWRFTFQEIVNEIQENKLDDGTRPLTFDEQCKIRFKKLGDTPYTFPLSRALCSRIICEQAAPFPLSNRHDFCGGKVTNSAWQISADTIDFPLTFSAAVRSDAFEQLHLNTPDLSEHFDLNLHKLFVFGPCPQSKTYNFDDKLFIYLATVLVFLPSSYSGGNYRFIDDNDDNEDLHRHVFDQHHSGNSKPYILILPADCQHEIEPIGEGYKLLLVYHLVSNTNSIQELFSLLAKPANHSPTIESAFLSQRLHRIFAYWEKNRNCMPTKLLIPIQHPLDYSPYFSMLFRDKYRGIIDVVLTAVRQFSSFSVYCATLQHDEPFGNKHHSRLLVHTLHLLHTTERFVLKLDAQHERTVIPNAILGELHMYIDSFEQAGGRQQVLSTGSRVFRNYSKFHVLLIIPSEYQWDFLLDEHSFACHHLCYMLSLPTHFVDPLCIQLFNCILRDKTASKLPFDELIRYLIILHARVGLAPALTALVKLLFQHEQFQDELFSNQKLYPWLSRLTEALHDWPSFSMEFLELFRKIITASMPTKLNEIVQFLQQFPNKTLRALFVNILLRSIFKRRGLSRHILLSTLCSIFHLMTVDGSYSVDCLLTLAYHVIKRTRKTSADNDIIQKSFQIHLIPMLINIYRQIKQKEKKLHSLVPLSPAFVFIYQYCSNTLNYYCSTVGSSTSPLNVISMNEAQLMCPCESCYRLQNFLTNAKSSTLLFDFSRDSISDHCLRHTLSKFPMLTLEYKHDPCTGREQTLIVSKCGYEQEQKQLCFHLRRLLLQLHQI